MPRINYNSVESIRDVFIILPVFTTFQTLRIKKYYNVHKFFIRKTYINERNSCSFAWTHKVVNGILLEVLSPPPPTHQINWIFFYAAYKILIKSLTLPTPSNRYTEYICTFKHTHE